MENENLNKKLQEIEDKLNELERRLNLLVETLDKSKRVKGI